MKQTFNIEMLGGFLAYIAAFVLNLTGHDFSPLVNQIVIVAGSALFLYGRFKASAFSFTSTTLYATILAMASAFLSGTSSPQLAADTVPQIGTIFQALLGIAALLGYKINLVAQAVTPAPTPTPPTH